jgi:hypothetical protein
MGMNRLFWSQELLDRWILEEKISLEDDRLMIKEDDHEYRVSQAVYFVADVGDGDDPHDLVGRVKEAKQLEEMGAEHYMDSVLVEDCAYEVKPGFIGLPFVSEAGDAQERPKDISGALAMQAGDGEDGEDDRELLAKFLLENL